MRRISIVPFLFALAACGGGSGGSNGPPPPITVPAQSQSTSFTALPLDPSTIAFAVPLGNIVPPSHTLPSYHVYLYSTAFTNPNAGPIPVVAPASGIVVPTLGGSQSLWVKMNATMTYYLGNVNLNQAYQPGQTISAGQNLGTLATGTLDFGFSNTAIAQPFVLPSRYEDDYLYADSPYKHFSSSLQPAIYAKVQSTGADPDGRLCYDVAGHLAGNWFLAGLPVDNRSVSATQDQLVFAYDNQNPTLMRVSIGGTLSLQGLFGLAAGSPDPVSITPANGTVTYSLTNPEIDNRPGIPQGWMTVQMLANDQIKIETFPLAATSTAFDANAIIYTR